MAEQQAVAALIAAIHCTPRRGVLAVAGGGSGLLSDLLQVAGASATVLEASVPYAARALRDFLGAEPEQACCAETARALAMCAFARARQLGGDFGFAITAALATNRPRRGAHRAHLAFQDASTTRVWTLSLGSDGRDGSRALSRLEEERMVADAGIQALAFSLGVGAAPNMSYATAEGGAAFAELMLRQRTHVFDGEIAAVLPGAFNPLHDGHRAMREDAARRLGCPVAFELCIANIDKPPLDYLDLNRRLEQFAPGEIVVTNAPTFVAKARILGGVAFVVGADTLARIATPRYYAGGGGFAVAARDAALAEMAALGCSFLVYGRVDGSVFRTLANLSPPPALAAMCIGVPESEFRNDLSSTALRRRR